ncbi:signal peptidase [Alkalibacillus flavidus]|uniref:Signal peptidase I n=1 Tax=Alkalibacillus flavidus TaxID=546021 RepID=A0ABV2KXT5_9BACI
MKAKTMKWLSCIMNTMLVGLLVTIFVLVMTNISTGGSPSIFGQELKVVYSGSMEPEIQTGSIIGINQNYDVRNLAEQDIIMFQEEEGTYVTHRIIEVINNDGQLMFRTKGDNNNAADSNAVLPDNIYGQYSGLHVPYIGYVMDFANSNIGLMILLVVPGLWLIVWSVKTIISAYREEKQSHQPDQPSLNEHAS